MSDYLPASYTAFRSQFPDVAGALDRLGSAVDGAGSLDSKTMRLVKLGIAIGASAEGAVRSNVRKARDAGATWEELNQVAVAAITTAGFPSAVAGLAWISEVRES